MSEVKHTPQQLVEAFCIIGERAISMHHAWLARNAARLASSKLLRAYRDETGEWFNPEDHAHEKEELEIVSSIAAKKAAQKMLNNERRKLRAAIAQATGSGK